MKKIHALFLSDTHLGTKACKADLLSKFLDKYPAKKYFLVGDIIDGYRMSKKFYWPKGHWTIIKKIMEIAHKKEIQYITGNHDEFLRSWLRWEGVKVLKINNIVISNRTTYKSLSGKKYSILHGDLFDYLMIDAKIVRFIGDSVYHFLIWFNSRIHFIRKILNLNYWSFFSYIKKRSSKIKNFVNKFENMMVSHIYNKGFDGIICGHVHYPSIRVIDGLDYMNCGDWVDSCSALAEFSDGSWGILYI